jgi:hypothetical protein
MILDKENKSEKIRIIGLQILSNLSLRESLRHKILENEGIELFLKIVKKEKDLF